MSWQACVEAECRAALQSSPIDMVIVPRTSDLGGFEVRRALPSRQKRMVGPFIFFDQMGPSEFLLGQGLDVRPHPHIGLATVTYLFRGEILHRDSLGTVQPIRPGELNWMTAGRGIAHSERTPLEHRTRSAALFGIQAWVALPERFEETTPAFVHHPASALPEIKEEGLSVRVIAGTLLGARSPVETLHETIYADAAMEEGAVFPWDADHEERAIYVAEGEIEIGGERHMAGRLLVFRPGETVSTRALEPSRVLLLGGAVMDGPRYIWWNFVSTRKERIDEAKADWKAGRFDRVIDDSEFIPLPDMSGP